MEIKTILAVLCVAAAGLDSAFAQESSATAEAAPAADAADSVTSSGWLLGRPNRVVNPFRATPAPGTMPTLKGPQRPAAPSVALPRAAGANTAQSIPENAAANAAGSGWTCNYGFRREAQTCVAVAVPENATLDFTGHGWMCNRGFRRQPAGCVAVVVPENASLVGVAGAQWACNYGFRRQGQSCVAVVVPQNASLDQAGHAWVCNAGYERREQGCIDDATARLQKQADRVVNARPGVAKAPEKPAVSVNSGENRNGRTSKAKVVIGRF